MNYKYSGRSIIEKLYNNEFENNTEIAIIETLDGQDISDYPIIFEVSDNCRSIMSKNSNEPNINYFLSDKTKFIIRTKPIFFNEPKYMKAKNEFNMKYRHNNGTFNKTIYKNSFLKVIGIIPKESFESKKACVVYLDDVNEVVLIDSGLFVQEI